MMYSAYVAQLIKNPPVMQDWTQQWIALGCIPGLEDPLENRKATHSSILA